MRELIASAEAAHDDALAATAETNGARLALRRKDYRDCDRVADAGRRYSRAIAGLLQSRNGPGFCRLGRVRDRREVSRPMLVRSLCALFE